MPALATITDTNIEYIKNSYIFGLYIYNRLLFERLGNMRIFWPLAMIICFGFLDMVTTVIVYTCLGTFDYEKGFLLAMFFNSGGIFGVIVEKMALTTISAILLYVLAKYRTNFDLMCTLMCAGTSIVGLLVSASNLIGTLTLSTLSVGELAWIRSDMRSSRSPLWPGLPV